MMTSSSDYFQLAYGELSETDNEAAVPNRFSNSISEGVSKTAAVSDKDGPMNPNANCDTDVEMARSFVLRGWGKVESIQDVETFMALLDRVPPTKVKHSLEENLALIDSRIQYLDELKAENKPAEAQDDKNEPNEDDNEDELLAPLGQPIEYFENHGVGPFLESLLRSLESMLDNSLYVNLQTTSVLAALASYSQPLLAHYFFDQRMLLQSGVKNLFKVLEMLKVRIDTYASSLDGFEVLLERGIKFLRSRAERYEKVSLVKGTFGNSTIYLSSLENSRQYMSHLRSSESYDSDCADSKNSPKGLFNR
ncbi:unnamed protein product [Gongylonema pulchrum]|uniref:DUF5917 domain-containing protein n=1 Tax=Gongylonema pulchrum TaxID=637853 RepID=A0A183EDB0_9BILA|nr:unnamed protein product [Gongylonema pulchrum]